MRILFALPPHLPMRGGAQITNHLLARELVRRGHELSVLAAQQLDEPVPERETRWGYPTLNTTQPGRELKRLLKSDDPECVVIGAYSGTSDIIAGQLIWTLGDRPALLYLHDRAALRHAPGPAGARVVVPSAYMASVLADRGAQAEVLPPIIGPEYAVESSRRVVLFVNPVLSKGRELVLELARARPDIPFAMVRCWPIPDIERLDAEVAALPNVELRDHTEDPGELYGDARVVIVPSEVGEAFGRVAAEPLVSGIPVIAFAAGGLPEAVGDGGILLEPGTGVDGWAAALGSLWDDEEVYADCSRLAVAQADDARLSAQSVGDRFEALAAEVAAATA